ncbi:MAG TPA: hypothetical protein VHK26_14460 [Methyloceanibacter sp.]|jgi:hypothetical protein|nr:hypothetical protein [Methyloceanibacter sp.]
MAPIFALRLVLLLPALLLMQQLAANAAPSLAEAIKQTDAKYLDAPDAEGSNDAPTIDAGSGEDDDEDEGEPVPQEISQGGVKAILSYEEETSEDGDAMRAPVVVVFADNKEIAKLEGDAGFGSPLVGVQIAELDPGNPHPEVIVSFFTGGAHCCSDTRVITSNKDGSAWQTVEVGEFDGGPLLATDLNGDGRYEFRIRDNAFLYAFACYACSEAPLELLTVENGAVKNVTTEPSFKPAHAAYLKGMIEGVPDEDVNGFLAGYVGEKILLGEGKQAWELMVRYYDKASDWGLETCDQPLNEVGECPGQEIKLTFPDALERMLKENGYNVEK